MSSTKYETLHKGSSASSKNQATKEVIRLTMPKNEATNEDNPSMTVVREQPESQEESVKRPQSMRNFASFYQRRINELAREHHSSNEVTSPKDERPITAINVVALQSSLHEQELSNKRKSSLEQPIILNVPAEPPRSDRSPLSISSGNTFLVADTKTPKCA